MNRLVNTVFVASQVVKGFGRGSKQLGIPTANLEEDIAQSLKIDSGIYYGFAQLLHPPGSPLNVSEGGNSNGNQANDDTADSNSLEPIVLDTCRQNPIYPMVCSFGWNPTFHNKVRTLEVHILHSFPDDFYGSLIRIAICGFIRPEVEFESVDKLIVTIHQDIDFAKEQLTDAKRCWTDVVTDRFFTV